MGSPWEGSMHDMKMLAYLGDAVFELEVRKHILDMGITDPKEANQLALGYVTATRQARALKNILPLLNEEETELCRKGRNLKSENAPKSATFAEYRMATALEILFGYLYRENRYDRLQEIIVLVLQECVNS